MYKLFSILKRQRKWGAFPTADAMRAAKAAANNVSVPLDLEDSLDQEPEMEPVRVKVVRKKKSDEIS